MSAVALLLPPPLAGGFLSLQSTDTWVLVAFLIFVGILLYAKVPAFVAGALDSRAERIRSQIAEARSLREEAQRKLADAERRTQEASSKAAEIVTRAQEEAREMAANAQSDMEAMVARRLRAAEDQIRRVEQDAERAVRDAAIDSAIGAVRDTLRNELPAGAAATLADRGVAEATARF